MASRLAPVQWLALLLAFAAAASGWLYGLHWKRVARGGDTTHEERLLIDLQDQLDRMRAENERLTARLHEREGGGRDGGSGGGDAEGPAVPGGSGTGSRGRSVAPPGAPPPVAQ